MFEVCDGMFCFCTVNVKGWVSLIDSSVNEIYITIIMPCREKTGFMHICENKDADQLRGNRKADQRLCFRYTDSTIPPLPKYEISSL